VTTEFGLSLIQQSNDQEGTSHLVAEDTSN
jgi:hypothetical protein